MDTSGADVFVGLDWGEQRHVLRAVDPQGEERNSARSFATDAAGLAALVEWVLALVEGDPGRAVVGIERPDEPVVVSLLEANLRVGYLNPKQADRFRDRQSSAGAKDDERDALVLADSLRTDPKAYTVVPQDPAPVAELRSLTTLRHELMVRSQRVANQLRDQLRRCYPQALGLLVDNLPDEFACRLLEAAPTSAAAGKLSVRTVENLRRRHRIRRLTARDVVSMLQAPGPPLAAGAAVGAAAWILALVAQWRLYREQMVVTEQGINDLLAQLCEPPEPGAEEARATGAGQVAGAHRVAVAVCSMPFGGPVTRGGLVAEAWQSLAEDDLQWVRTHGGTAPVTRRSGKSRWVTMRYACNRRLRYVLYHWARLAVQTDGPWSQAYAQLRQRGHSAGRAYRTIADRLLRVLIAMIRDGTTYDPERLAHRAAPRAA